MSAKYYPKGSEWRKWDLHVHSKTDTNYSYSANNDISKKEQNDSTYAGTFIEHIYSIDNLGAVAITDHNKADWIDRILAENENFIRGKGIKPITILPGVEVESSDGIHLLVIFNPETQINEVRSNFRKSTWKETIEHFITATKNPSNPNALKTTEEILEEAEKWDALCIFPHVTSNKGFFRINSGDRKTKIYQHRLTQIFQIPISGLSDQGYENIVLGRDPNYGNKSITLITSSDAKKLEDIGRNNLWIKADPTFEGLKQIIYEPEERVYIGEEPPRKIERNKIIKSLTISNSNRWFNDDYTIPINEEMVSVIGGKGTGKTAILDLIAYATGSYKCYEKDETKSKSFLKKAFRKLNGTVIKVEWDDGNPDEITINGKLEECYGEGKVRYLPQDYVDQLCSEIGKKELEKQIEDIIFQKILSEDKAAFPDFKTYKEAQLKVLNDEKEQINQNIESISLEIYQCRQLINSKSDKTKELDKVSNDIKKFESEIEKILAAIKDSSQQSNVIAKLRKLNNKKSDLEKYISELKTKILKIDEIYAKISNFEDDSKKFIKKLKEDLKNIDIPRNVIDSVKIILYPEILEETLNERKQIIENEIKEKQKDLKKTNESIKKENSKITLEKSKREKIKEINDTLSTLRKRKDALEDEIKRIEAAEKSVPLLLENREKLFIDYFELIFEEKNKLRKIYSPLESVLAGSVEENEQLFNFTIKFNFDTDTMARRGHELIDLRADGIFRQSRYEKLKEKIEEVKFNLNLDSENLSEENREAIKKFIKNVEELFTSDNRKIETQLKEKNTEKDFYDWLFSTDYYSINYSIQFNGIELSNLSPGLKGVALLILFLELDEEDRRPILIDQPEENLDNRSVYNTLVKYFRKAKKRRQVIIVTHNPNLVVNTDSEQIIVANFDKTATTQPSIIQPSIIFYVSGSLENTFKDDGASNLLEKQGIREHICEILEGGKEAFEKREKKYGF